MVFNDYHVHTTFSDGKNDMESVVKAAIESGAEELGFSDHSYTFFDQSYCMKKDYDEYFAQIKRLKEKYKGKIKILSGVEQDLYSKKSVKQFDYAIGSVHYFRVRGKYYPVDESRNNLIETVNSVFGGDFYAACETYFKAVKKFAKREDIKIIGHFDLISKFNGNGELFDEKNPRYLSAAYSAAKSLVSAGKVFEINTGALSKNLRTDAYPNKEIRDYIKSIGGKFVLSSDCHKKEDLFFAFDKFVSELN